MADSEDPKTTTEDEPADAASELPPIPRDETSPAPKDETPEQDDERGPLAAHGGVEADNPPAAPIFMMLFALSLVVVAAGVGMTQLFGLTSLAELHTKDLGVDNQELIELRARDWGRLTQYDSLDGGRYQVPIERAMEKLAADPALLAPLSDGGPSGPADGGETSESADAARDGAVDSDPSSGEDSP